MFGSRKSSKDEEILQNIEYMLGERILPLASMQNL
jgi:hypothetical protein